MAQESSLEDIFSTEDENYLKVEEVKKAPDYIEISCQLVGSIGLVWVSNDSTPALVRTCGYLL